MNSDDVAREGQGQGSCEGFSDSRVAGMTNWRLSRQWGLRSGCAQQRGSWEPNGDNLGFCRSSGPRWFHICWRGMQLAIRLYFKVNKGSLSKPHDIGCTQFPVRKTLLSGFTEACGDHSGLGV